MNAELRVFATLELREARAFAAAGGIAIHLHRFVTHRAPACFKRDVAAGYPIAHVFGADAEALAALARRCGVRVVLVERRGTPSQHVDMCGRPLRRLLELAGVVGDVQLADIKVNSQPRPRGPATGDAKEPEELRDD